MIPMSGALGATANAVSIAQKDIYNDWRTYLMNRLPGVNTLLPEQIDPWTGNRTGVERRAIPMFPLIVTFGIKFDF